MTTAAPISQPQPPILKPSANISTILLPAVDRTLGYAEILVKDIPAEKFAHMPHPNMNHPAFCIGHLSTYPDKMLGLLGKADLAQPKPGYAELFSVHAKCIEKPGLYPPKDELVTYFLDRHRALRKVLPDVPDDVFHRPNPMEGRMRELFPTVGSAVIFMLCSHTMLHLGQISAWRRAIGLGPVM